MNCVFIGLGSLGFALASRLASQNVNVLAWNRTIEKAKDLASQFPDLVSVKPSLEESLQSPDYLDAPIFICLPNYQAELDLILPQAPLFHNRILISMCSGDPDEARSFANTLSEKVQLSVYVDGCHAGNPAAALAGRGIVMVSSLESDAKLKELGIVALCERLGRYVNTGTKIGSNKALDYAVVDFYMMNLLTFINGVALLEAEGLEPALLVEQLRYRLPGFPDAMANNALLMEERQYDKKVSASVDIVRAFFEERIPYLDRHGVNHQCTDFFAGLLRHPKVCGEKDEFASHDILRLQELIRNKK